MAKVRTREKCFIDNTLRNEGEVFEYDGPSVPYFDYLDGTPVAASESVTEPERRKPGRPRKTDASSDAMA